MNLRLRLTLTYALLTSLLLALAALGVFWGTRGQIQKNTDTALEDVGAVLRQNLQEDRQLNLDDAQITADFSVVVMDHSGLVLAQSGVPHPLMKALHPVGWYSGEKFRLLVLPLNAQTVLMVGKDTHESTLFLKTLLRILLPIYLVLMLLSMGLGYLLADRALRPVDTVTRKAREITETGRYQERVPGVIGNDEMAQLVLTFNEMLDHLQSTIEREKTFARLAAHELRTPLTILQGRIGLALARERDISSYQKHLSEMQGGVDRLVNLTETLLKFSQAEQVLVEQVDLQLAVQQAVQEFPESVRQQIQTQLQSSWVQAETVALQQLIFNLLDNALKYGPANENILLQVEDHQLTVQDAGKGPPREEWERLLRPLERGMSPHHPAGSGLGLAFVASVCQQWNATLTPHWLPEGFQVTVKFQLAEAQQHLSQENPTC
ncbi:sensor histidine kinase [Deinococcus roseus]|uniref:histidine kinase n=1 Tax=Deinococcus roseus TaxID=392414 RepID=A0ABQ2DH67_9DEIO|nr:HAMP domain-containing sensor histidine kinase [Deinococcus roseus]GGJ57578.1 hypothetical protein GCM10008938_49580 [Deinococcus roseus]